MVHIIAQGHLGKGQWGKIQRQLRHHLTSKAKYMCLTPLDNESSIKHDVNEKKFIIGTPNRVKAH